MGTRSATGVYIDLKSKLSYNQFDGYPSGVGQKILDELKADIKAMGLEDAIGTWKQKARTMRVIDEAGPPPTPDQIKACEPYTNLGVSGKSVADWYCLLRETQGSILKRLNAGFMLDGSQFIQDSLFCEWAYVLNLDEESLEVYEGFQMQPHDRGRYAEPDPTQETDAMTVLETVVSATGVKSSERHIPAREYYPCALIATIKLADLMSIDDLEDHLKSIGAIKDEDED